MSSEQVVSPIMTQPGVQVEAQTNSEPRLCDGPGCTKIGVPTPSQSRCFCSKSCRYRFYNTKQRRELQRVGRCAGPGCHNLVLPSEIQGRKRLWFCSPACQHLYRNIIGYRRHREREPGACEGPGCTNMVPAQMAACQQKHYFCCRACMDRFYWNKDVVGKCERCGGPIRGRKCRNRKHRHCSAECRTLDRVEQGMAPTGPFRATIEEYLADNSYYREGTLPSVKMSLLHFFTFAIQDLKISSFEGIGPSVVSKFIAHEQHRGIRGRNFVGHLSTFWEWLIAEERVDMENPVRRRIHAQRSSPPKPRPYTDAQIRQLWPVVEASGDLALMLAFWIGVECGLRVGETCNIRLSDVDADAQTIEVRLPTKNGCPRTVRFHDKVAQYLPLWLAQRDPECGHDHLLHTRHSSRTHFTTQTLDTWFKKHMRPEPEPAHSFVYHRLRHSWATSLLNAGIDIATLKELGGWKSLSSLERYILVLPDTIRRQYEQAYVRMQEQQEATAEEVPLSLVEFAQMNAAGSTSNAASAG